MMIGKFVSIIKALNNKYPRSCKAIGLILTWIVGSSFINNYISWDIFTNKHYMQTSDDETDTNKLAGKKVVINPANESSSLKDESPNPVSTEAGPSKDESSNPAGTEAGPSKDKSPNFDSYNPTYRVGTEEPGTGKRSALYDMQLRLEKMMLDSTQGFIDQSDSEIKDKNLHTKDESELTPEEITLLKQRESHVDHMAKTSANVLTKESESKMGENPVDPNISKRDVKSADLELDKKDIKKRK